MGGSVARSSTIPGLCGLLLWAAGAYADEPQGRFDGVWNTVLACAAAGGAQPYSYQFSTTVKGGVLHGERGVRDAPGWLQLDGNVRPDGSAEITARGVVGSASVALGNRPSGTPYTYAIEARFAADSGTGRRTQGRACTVSFNRQGAGGT
jgi:hypothetical protein